MRVSKPVRTRFFALLAALASCAIVLSGCAPTGAGSTRVVPKEQQLFPELRDYPSVDVVANLAYRRVDGTTLRLDVCLPPKAGTATRPAVVSIHGGSWAHGAQDNPNWRDVCEWIASMGYVAVSVGYRLAPEYTYPDALHDIQHAVEWLREGAQVKRFHIDPTLIGAFGGSAGGNLAALLGTVGIGSLDRGDRVAAVAELSGPSNLTSSGAEESDFTPYVLSYLGCYTYKGCRDARAASPLYNVNRTDPPFFIGHSTDERIPLVQSTAFVKRLRAVGVPVTFVTVEGHEHSIAMLDARMRARVSDFFHATLHHGLFGGANP